MKGRLLFIFTVLVFLLSFGRVRTVSADELPSSGTYVIHSALAENKVLDIAGASKKSGGNLQIYEGNASAAQQFTLTRLSDGTCHISPVCSALALDVEGAKAASGTNVRQYTANGTRAQRWRLIPAEDGTFGIEPVCAPGFRLDIAGASRKNGTNVRIYAANGTAAQRFSFMPVIPAAPTAADTPAPAQGRQYIVAIDPGHQRHGSSALEPNAPGSSVMKARVTSGTEGLWSGLEEYDLNLRVGLKLRAELEARGYSVYMVRTTHDVDLSNAERAQMAAAAHADIFIRIHANSSDSPSVRGVMAYQPSSANRYLSSSVIADSQRLSELLVANECAATGFLSRGILDGDDMTGINWASMPVSIIEMGFMSNREDDLYMASEAGQSAIARGLANGVDAYFGK